MGGPRSKHFSKIGPGRPGASSTSAGLPSGLRRRYVQALLGAGGDGVRVWDTNDKGGGVAKASQVLDA
jgi:hypothetical protein